VADVFAQRGRGAHNLLLPQEEAERIAEAVLLPAAEGGGLEVLDAPVAAQRLTGVRNLVEHLVSPVELVLPDEAVEELEGLLERPLVAQPAPAPQVGEPALVPLFLGQRLLGVRQDAALRVGARIVAAAVGGGGSSRRGRLLLGHSERLELLVQRRHRV